MRCQPGRVLNGWKASPGERGSFAMLGSLKWFSLVVPVMLVVASAGGCGDETSGSGGTSSSSGSADGGAGGTGGMSTGSTGGMGGMGSSSTGSSSSGSGAGGGCPNPMLVDNADPVVRCADLMTDLKTPSLAPAHMVGADKVIEYSTKYASGTMDYTPEQATGAPDVYPASGDEPKAWATAAIDTDNEFITVGFTTPQAGSTVWVYETYNPGAVKTITVTDATGDHVIYTNATPKPIGQFSHIVSAATSACSPISKIRVDLDSVAVGGYNEIDAIGILP